MKLHLQLFDLLLVRNVVSIRLFLGLAPTASLRFDFDLWNGCFWLVVKLLLVGAGDEFKFASVKSHSLPQLSYFGVFLLDLLLEYCLFKV